MLTVNNMQLQFSESPSVLYAEKTTNQKFLFKDSSSMTVWLGMDAGSNENSQSLIFILFYLLIHFISSFMSDTRSSIPDPNDHERND